jgi:hypothetical protein
VTDRPTPPGQLNDEHLSDEQLSGALDGVPDPGETLRHLDSCPECTGRLDRLSEAAGLVATPVARLTRAKRDEMIATAVAAAGSEPAEETPATSTDAPVIHLGARQRKLRPLASVAGVAAALVLLVGVAGFLRSNRPDGASTTALSERSADDLGSDQFSSTGAAAATDSAAGPEVVARDMGEYSDPAALTAALTAMVAAPAGAELSTTRLADQNKSASAGSGGVAPAASAPDRAACVERARQIGAQGLGDLLSTSTVRWKNAAAEVLVFTLAEPAGGVSRQAMVMSRPACELLADPRF